MTAEITAANKTLQGFKMKDMERQREADKAMDGEKMEGERKRILRQLCLMMRGHNDF